MSDEAADGPAIRRLSSRVVYENPWMVVREDEIERPDGSRGIYGVIDKPDFALVIPAEDGGFHLVEEYRYPIGRRTWSFPQGTMPGRAPADPERLARRELAEETGLRAGDLVHLGFLHCSHGMSRQGCNVYLATALRHGEADREHEEQDMRQAWVSRAAFEQMISAGAITDDATMAAYTLLILHERAADGSAADGAAAAGGGAAGGGAAGGGAAGGGAAVSTAGRQR